MSLKLSAIRKRDAHENIELQNKVQCPIFVHPYVLRAGTNLISGKVTFTGPVRLSVDLNISLQTISQTQTSKGKVQKGKEKNKGDMESTNKSERNNSDLSIHSVNRRFLLMLDERI